MFFKIVSSPEMVVRCLLPSAVFRSVTAGTVNRYDVQVALSKKSQQERTQLCIEFECPTAKTLRRNNKLHRLTSGQN